MWFAKPDITALAAQRDDGMVRHLDIRFCDIGDDFLSATMPVDRRTKQPFGLLHGGASVVLAETIGSVGGNLVVDPQQYYCVGLEINANHLNSARSGRVTGTGTALHLGKTTQVWQIRIVDEADKLICVSRITLAVLRRRN
ncbi:MAG: hotdog fold thioesterase [Gammaproteobacteria bacterium]|nr:hotdog fold thioesterase [Gammaproteobacteria bacterium]